MSNEILPPGSDTCLATPFQLALFPADPWGAGQIVEIVERPSAEISRALIGPLVLADGSESDTGDIRCLAVSHCGTYIASIWSPRRLLKDDPAAFWKKVSVHLDQQLNLPIAVPLAGFNLTPPDSLRSWSNPTNWFPAPAQSRKLHPAIWAYAKLQASHQLVTLDGDIASQYMRIEAEATAAAWRQVTMGVQHLFQALEPGLFKPMTKRAGLSMAVAHRLITMASSHSPSAIVYARQALATESQGLLQLVASDHPKPDAQLVRNAIFSGGSLPEAFANLGIAKGTYRQSLYKIARSPSPPPPLEHLLCDIPMSGRQWLATMRLTHCIQLHHKDDWVEFSRAIQIAVEQNFEDTETVRELLIWCTSPRVRGSSKKLVKLFALANAFELAVQGLTGIAKTIEQVLPFVIAKVEGAAVQRDVSDGGAWSLDTEDLAQLVVGVAQYVDLPISEVAGPLFEKHPGLPRSYPASGEIAVIPLDSLSAAMAHGADCQNCVQHTYDALRYTTDGSALYGLRAAAGPVGTFALKYYSTGIHPAVQVVEVSGMGNHLAGYDLCRIAQSLADAFNAEGEFWAWVGFNVWRDEWRCQVKPVLPISPVSLS